MLTHDGLKIEVLSTRFVEKDLPITCMIQRGEIFGSKIKWSKVCQAHLIWRDQVNGADQPGIELDDAGIGYAGWDAKRKIYLRYDNKFSDNVHCFRILVGKYPPQYVDEDYVPSEGEISDEKDDESSEEEVQPQKETSCRRCNRYQHPKGAAKATWHQVLMQEILHIHDRQTGLIDFELLAGRGKELYQQVSARQNPTWKGPVYKLRATLREKLNDIGQGKAASLYSHGIDLLKHDQDSSHLSKDPEHNSWCLTRPLPKIKYLSTLPIADQWECVKIFSQIFGHLPSPTDAVNPTLTQILLCWQEIKQTLHSQQRLKKKDSALLKVIKTELDKNQLIY